MSVAVGWGMAKGGWLVVPDLPCEVDLEPVYDWLTINFVSGVNNGPSDTAPRLGMCEVAGTCPHKGL